MLVLSRKEKERFLFPELGVSVQIVRVSRNGVRVGIEAPPEISVLREELADQDVIRTQATLRRKQRHDLVNRLNAATLALHLVQKQLETGQVEEAEQLLQQTLAAFSELNELVASAKASAASTVSPSKARRHALLVEDNPQERELLAGYLRLCGYEVDTAADGVEALQFLQEHSPPDLVLLDMQMPRMDGSETLRAIRRNDSYQDLKVFAVSGSDPKSIQVNWKDRRVDRWFSKPINPDVFVKELNREMSAATA